MALVRSKPKLLTDEEANDAFADRAERLKMNCCVCESVGWSIYEEYVPERNMIVSSCTHDHHSVCIRCFSTLATNELKDQVLSGQKMKRILCPFPYSHQRCTGYFNRRVWSRFVPIELIQLQQNIASGKGFDVKCTKCGSENRVQTPEGIWKCSCGRISCGRCDAEVIFESCNCSLKSQHQLESGYSRTFSEKTKNGATRPMRRKQVTPLMITCKIKTMNDDFPWFHAKCPSCDASLFKSSACNDMKHCGKAHVCYFCSERSFPWEDGFPQSHWESCPRWDHDTPWYPCREGECQWESRECDQKTHAPFVKQMHELRWQAAMNFLRKDNMIVFALMP